MAAKTAKSGKGARATAQKIVLTTLPPDGEVEDIEENEELDSDVLRALTELEGAGSVTWQIHRESQPDPGFCGELTTGELSLRTIAERWGPGRYQVKGIQPGGQYFKSRRMTIAKGLNDSPLHKVANELKESLAGKPAPQTDQTQLMLHMMQQNTQVLVAALNRPQAPAFDYRPLLTAIPGALVAMRDLFKPAQDSSALDSLLKGVKLAKELSGDSKGSESWGDIVKEALPAARELFASRGAPQPSQAISRPTPMLTREIPTPEAVAPTPELPPPQEADDMKQLKLLSFLREQLALLLRRAAENRNPEVYAEVFLDSIPPEFDVEIILAAFQRPDWFEMLCSFEPNATHYQGWLTQFRESVLEQFGNTDEPTADDQPAIAIEEESKNV